MIQIAVCGMGVVSALGVGCKVAQESLRDEKCGIASLSLFRSKIDVPVGEVKLDNNSLKQLLDIDTRNVISRTALLGMVAVREAMLDANIPSGSRIGLISGTTVGGMDLSENFYPQFKEGKGRLSQIIGHDCADSTLKIANYCGIQHFSTTISTACSSAANAIMLGSRLIRQGILDYAIVGGTDALCRFTLNGFNTLMILDPDYCKPFDANRKGLNLGEGAGYLVLTSIDRVTNPYCTLLGCANANDAFHQTASDESGEGAYRAMTAAIKTAGITVGEIDYINTHGTGTANNDASEYAALCRVFGNEIPPYSSTKGFTGHTLGAAGGIEAVFSVLAIKYGVIYANLRFTNPLEGMSCTPVTTTLCHQDIKHVLSNSFGFGGNCSTLLFSKI